MKPLLAHIYEPHRVTYPCYVQPKLNGIRALYQNGSFQSRDQLPFPTGLLEHLSAPLRAVFDERTILDGELYVHGWPLQRINAAVTPVRQKPTEDTLKVEYHVFDVVRFDQSFQERTIELHKLGLVNCIRVPTRRVVAQHEADSYYHAWVSQGYEGMMYRLGDCPYTVPKQPFYKHALGCGTFPSKSRFLSDKDNRCWHLLKRKDWQDDEFECVGIVEGEGKLKGTLGALECRTKNLAPRISATECRYYLGQPPLTTDMHRRFNVGSGLTDAERSHYWANPPIGRLVKVKYLVLSSDGIPLNPTILAIL